MVIIIFYYCYYCRAQFQPIYEIIARDLDIEKIKRQIATGMQNNSTSLTSYLTTWDNYREIWEISKDAFIQRYRDLNPSVASFDADIARLEALHKMNWIFIDNKFLECLFHL